MKRVLVIIDNGHGEDTKGKCSPDKSLYEWKWTREIAVTLHERLTQYGIGSVLLVPEDNDVALSARIAREKVITSLAKKEGKETLLISIHINAAGGDGNWKEAQGWTGWVAQDASEKSKTIAQLLYSEAEKRKLQGNRCVPKERYLTANFTILSDTSCPAVLTENLFQDNKDDVGYLLSKNGKNEIVDLHFQAILKYINNK